MRYVDQPLEKVVQITILKIIINKSNIILNICSGKPLGIRKNREIIKGKKQKTKNKITNLIPKKSGTTLSLNYLNTLNKKRLMECLKNITKLFAVYKKHT